MSAEPGGEVTSLLEKVRQGNQDAANQLVPLVYDELRRMAGAYMNRERANHSMQATVALVEPDSRGRVTLARWLRAGRQYIVSADDVTGAITLEPVGLVLSEEAASDLVEHPERVTELLSRAHTVARRATGDNLVTVDDLFDGI